MAVITHKNGTAAAVLDYDNTRELEKTIAKVAEDDAEQMAQIVNEFNSDLANIQEQIDASITSWFYTVNPTTSNPPASGWNTDEEKAAHIGDLYYNKDNGRGWRWQYVSDHYEWVEVTDQNVLDVLQSASKAQDALDSKRRNFVAQPVPPYDVGDLWSGGSQGDLKRCQTARTASESYNAADWVLATKYTDDLLASQAKDAADTAQATAEDAATKATAFIITDGDGIKVGRNVSTGVNYTRMSSGGFSVYANNTELFNAGYGSGNSASGTANAPYYTLGKRNTTTATYSSSTTYSFGDLAWYNSNLYVYIYSTSSSGHAPTSTTYWQRAVGNYSVAEGREGTASGYSSHTEGRNATATAQAAHAEGTTTKASGFYSHAEGNSCIASNDAAHAEGTMTVASGSSSHASGAYTEAAYSGQFVCGKYNSPTSGDYFEVGNGDVNTRSNAFRVTSSGNAYVAGTIYANSMSVTTFSPSNINTYNIDATSINGTSLSITGDINYTGKLTHSSNNPFKTFTATGTSSSVSAGSGGHITCTGTVPSGYKPIAIVQATTNHTFSGAISHMELTSNGAKIDVINTNSSGSQTYTGTVVILCTSLQSTGIV